MHNDLDFSTGYRPVIPTRLPTPDSRLPIGRKLLSCHGLTHFPAALTIKGSRGKLTAADVAQLAEHLICNQAVAGSIPAVSSPWGCRQALVGARKCGGVPKRPTGADCKSAGVCLRRFESFPHHWWCERRERRSSAGVAQLVERKPSKLDVAGSSPVSRSFILREVAQRSSRRICWDKRGCSSLFLTRRRSRSSVGRAHPW